MVILIISPFRSTLGGTKGSAGFSLTLTPCQDQGISFERPCGLSRRQYELLGYFDFF